MLDKETITRSRYKSIINRNYLQKLNYFLFEIYKTQKTIEGLNTSEYEVTDDVKNDYKDMYEDMTKVRERNNAFKELKIKNKEKIKKDKKEYFEYYQKNVLTFNDFSIFWSEKKNRSCQYCGVSETQIDSLNIKTKRFYSRGKTMEIDKINPFKEYIKCNIILSCYWCNNAKTDEFDLDEFKCIAKGIHTVWKKRLKENNPMAKIVFPLETYKEKKEKCEYKV